MKQILVISMKVWDKNLTFSKNEKKVIVLKMNKLQK